MIFVLFYIAGFFLFILHFIIFRRMIPLSEALEVTNHIKFAYVSKSKRVTRTSEHSSVNLIVSLKVNQLSVFS